MTVAELIEELKKLPQDKPVATEFADLSESSEIAGIRNDDNGDVPRVYIQHW